MSISAYVSDIAAAPSEFLDKLLAVCPDNLRPLFCSFKQPPDEGGTWAARAINDTFLKKLHKYGDRNRYITVSVFEGERRRKAEFKALVAVMIDDPGTKVPFDRIKLPPTYWIETSPGNYQAWYFLSVPITDRKFAERVIKALIKSGLAKDGKDPGMAGVTRYGRLPGGWNNKTSLDTPHRVKAYQDTRGCNYYTIEQIIQAYELDLSEIDTDSYDAIGSVDQLDVMAAENDPIYKMLDGQGLIKYQDGDKWQITCPWVEDHTGETDNGTALMIRPGGELGFKCHHGHCEGKNLGDVHDWLSENCPDEYESAYPKKKPIRNKNPESDEETLETTLKNFLMSGPSDVQIELAIPDFAEDFGVNAYSIRSILHSIKRELEDQEQAEDIDLDTLAKAAESELSLEMAFPKLLADAIATKCESDGLDPIRPVQSLLPCLASQLGSKTSILLKPAHKKEEEWNEYALISCIDIGNPSEGKSQTNRTITAPLVTQQNREFDHYARELDIYEQGCQIAKVAGTELPDPPERPYKLFVTGGTSEGIMKRISELPPRFGMLYICDELAGLLSGADQYKSGKGNFKNTLLTAMTSPLTGTEERSNIENGEITFLRQTLCICGSIQLNRVKHLFDPEYDESGLGSRFLCAYPNLPESFAKWSDTQVNIYSELEGLIEYLQDVGDSEDEPIQCVMDRKTHKRFTRRVETFRKIQIEVRESNLGLGAFIGKCPGHLGRLILLSHWIACYYEEEIPGEITQLSFNRACHLIDYYIGQFKLLQIEISGPTDLSKSQLYVLKRIKKVGSNGKLTVSQIYQGFRNSKKLENKTTTDIKNLFQVFETKGYGDFNPDTGVFKVN